MLSDIEIAQSTTLRPIAEIAAELGIQEEELELYGRYKAKINERAFARLAGKPDGKLVLVTAINPTPAGEGKTTTTAGLGQAMAKIGKNAVIALREPSLGPVFGIKGGAAGGGYAQVLPMEDINLHFTGDMHAITSANNLCCAMLDNHLQQGNALGIDPRRIQIKRCLDMNDRALRNIVIGLGGKINGVPREDGFIITVASEVMAILCLAKDMNDLKERLGNILIAYTYAGEPVYARDIKAEGAMAALLRDAVNPNLVQTIEGTPAIMHGGPFANIAHGCNSVRATRLALKLADYCITEAGFGSDLGAEKFMAVRAKPPPPRAWARPWRRLAKTPLSPCGSPPWGRCSASRAAPRGAAMPRCCPWRTSTSTLPGTCTPSPPPTTCAAPCWITTCSRATPWASTPGASKSSAAWI